jgi:hypothetical protein
VGIHGEGGFLGEFLPAMGRAADVEQNERWARIGECKHRFSDAQLAKCVLYADTAARDVQSLSDLPNRCGVGSEARWSEDRDQHFAWCIQKLRTPSEGEIESEGAARADALRSCREGSAEYGACPGCGSDVLRPEPSSGPSPFGDARPGQDTGVVTRPSRPLGDYTTRSGADEVGGVAAPRSDAGSCQTGFVWRLARPSDLVCVTPDARARTAQENAEAASHVDANGAYGPHTCVSGYVWREAFEGDLVCVAPAIRDTVARENAEAASRLARP